MSSIYIKTQLGGKFSTQDDGLFKLKLQLINSNIKVNYPKGNKIIKVQNGIPLTFDPQKTKQSFYEVEQQYLKSIKNTDLHIVYNKYLDQQGYIGESASVEIAYALIHNKPLLLLHKPIFSDKVANITQEVIKKNLNKIFIKNISQINYKKTAKIIRQISEKKTVYKLSVLEEIELYKIIESLLNSYKHKIES